MSSLKKQSSEFFNNKHRFYKVIFHSSIGFLFFIGLFFPFIKAPTLISGVLPLSKLPGSFIFEIILIAVIILYAYFMIINSDKMAKIILLIQLIFGTMFHLYGALLYRVGADSSATGAFGRIFLFLLLIIMWTTYIKQDLVSNLLKKVLPKTEDSLNSEEPQPEN